MTQALRPTAQGKACSVNFKLCAVHVRAWTLARAGPSHALKLCLGRIWRLAVAWQPQRRARGRTWLWSTSRNPGRVEASGAVDILDQSRDILKSSIIRFPSNFPDS